MGLLPRIRLVVDRPELDIAPEVAAMMRKRKEKKDVPPRFFTMKERVAVGVILIATISLGIFFWLGGGGDVPALQTEEFTSSEPIIPKSQELDWFNFDMGGINEKIIIEK